MKKLFNHRKKPYEDNNYYEDWDDEGNDTGDAQYDADEVDSEFGEDEYYADGEYSDEQAEYEGTDSEAYYSDSTEADEEYYAADEDEKEDGYYASEDGEEEESYYASENSEEKEGYYSSGYVEEEYYASDDNVEEDDYAAEKKLSHRKKTARAGGNKNFFAKIWTLFLNMGTMDRVIVSTGVAVLVLALVTVSVFASARLVDKQMSDFANVGQQLAGINLIGETGLLAVADAEQAKIAAANAVIQEHAQLPSVENKEYEEEEYTKDVTVALNLTSIQKDLKIKFINKKTGKLVANVPFKVTITDPDGKTSSWTDDDMDGIIYKKGITPGNYKVAVETLSGDKYKDYTLPDSAEKVEVKKDIEYKKVDVSNEIKSESQVNVSKEDTKINDTKVESKLTNTVEWVESSSNASNYKEVDKSTVPDPATLSYAGSFRRLAYVGGISPTSQSVKVGETFKVTASSDGVTLSEVVWSSSNTAVATVDTNGTVTAVGPGTAVISYQAQGNAVSGNEAVTGLTGSMSVTVTQSMSKGSVTVDNASPVLAVNAKGNVKATAAGFTAGKELSYSIVSNNTEVATATVDAGGNVSITAVKAGDAVLTLTVNYKDGGAADTAAAVNINVKVTANKTIALDKTTATVYIGTPVNINATIANATTNSAVTAESSDTNVATVAVNGRVITISGIKVGTANITVKYTENGEEVKAACAVTVKSNPRDDRTNKLKDVGGNQLYVSENNSYREAVYADYYTAGKFFIKSGVIYTGWQTLDGKVYFFDKNGNKVTGKQVIQGAEYNFAQDGSLVTGSGRRGIDVSKWNGTIDWTAVKNSGIEYVIIRCGYRGSSQGALIEDPKYAANIKGASAAGLKVGVYFFTQAIDVAEAVEEASMVLDLVKNYNISYPIFLDVEGSGGRGDKIDKATRTAVIQTFCKTIQDAGYTAGVYANKSWLTNKFDPGQLGSYKIWLAQYATAPTYSGRYELWQYQSTGRVSGISGNVDMNWSYLGY